MPPNAEDLGERAAGHANVKHLSKFAYLGIETPEQLSEHVTAIVDSKETLCFTAYTTEQTWRQADFYYHEPTNTMVVDPFNPEKEPTAYPAKNGIDDFYKKLEEAEGIEGRSIEVFHGMSELYPEVDKTPSPEIEYLNENISPYAEQGLPKTFEEYIGQCESPPPEKTQDKEQDLER